MRLFFLMALVAVPMIGNGQQQEIQRALIQRDQQSAEFARKGLENLHSRQIQEAAQPLPAHLHPYQREQMKQERQTALPPPDEKKSGSDPDYRPLPLPGGPRHGVEPIPAPSLGS